MAGTYKIGTTFGGLASITSLTVATYLPIPDPKGLFYPYSELLDKDSGGKKGVGYPRATWKWGFMRDEWRDVLRPFCTGASADLYIQTRGNDSADVFAIYTATMIWPDENNMDARRRMNFILEFTNLVPASS